MKCGLEWRSLRPRCMQIPPPRWPGPEVETWHQWPGAANHTEKQRQSEPIRTLIEDCSQVEIPRSVPAGLAGCETPWQGPQHWRWPARGSGCWRERRRHWPHWRPRPESPRTSCWRWSSPAGWLGPVAKNTIEPVSSRKENPHREKSLTRRIAYLLQRGLHVHVVGQGISSGHKQGSRLESLLKLEVDATEIIQTSREILRRKEQKKRYSVRIKNVCARLIVQCRLHRVKQPRSTTWWKFKNSPQFPPVSLPVPSAGKGVLRSAEPKWYCPEEEKKKFSWALRRRHRIMPCSLKPPHIHTHTHKHLRHDVVLLVDATGQGPKNFLGCQGKPQRAQCAHRPVNLGHGGILTNRRQEDVSRLIGHRDLRRWGNSVTIALV